MSTGVMPRRWSSGPPSLRRRRQLKVELNRGTLGHEKTPFHRDVAADWRSDDPDAGRHPAGNDRAAHPRSPWGAWCIPTTMRFTTSWWSRAATIGRSAMSSGEYVSDNDGEGFCQVYVNMIEGFWSLLRSWLRRYRGISRKELPLLLGFFGFVHDVRDRGKRVLGPCWRS